MKTLILQFNTVRRLRLLDQTVAGKQLTEDDYGNETAEGEVWISPSANIGYLTQEVFDLPLEKHQKIYFSKRRLKKEEKSKI